MTMRVHLRNLEQGQPTKQKNHSHKIFLKLFESIENKARLKFSYKI